MAGTLLKPLIDEAVAFLHRSTEVRPAIGIVLGTGLGALPEAMIVDQVVAFGDIPHFPTSAVASHANELVFGSLSGRPVVFMRGRVHYYEGFSMREVTFPIRVLRGLGVETLLLTSAVGGMNPLLELGQIVRVDDHINLMGDNPLIGPNEDDLGPRFPDMSEPYDKALQKRIEEVALQEGIPLRPGILVGVAGPNLETRAEYRFLRWCGADVVGMSMIPENLVAVHGGMRVAALAVVTDLCLPDALEPVAVEKILQTAAQAAPSLMRLITGWIARIGEPPDPA